MIKIYSETFIAQEIELDDFSYKKNDLQDTKAEISHMKTYSFVHKN